MGDIVYGSSFLASQKRKHSYSSAWDLYCVNSFHNWISEDVRREGLFRVALLHIFRVKCILILLCLVWGWCLGRVCNRWDVARSHLSFGHKQPSLAAPWVCLTVLGSTLIDGSSLSEFLSTLLLESDSENFTNLAGNCSCNNCTETQRQYKI